MLSFVFGLGVFVLAVAAVVRRRWRDAAAREEEVFKLLAMASEETAMAELGECEPRPLLLLQCAVCFVPTTRRCSHCKSVRYCSGKCQITHWRQGHKDECHYFRIQFERSDHNAEPGSSYDEEGMQTGLTPHDNLPKYNPHSDVLSNLENPDSGVSDLFGSTSKIKETQVSKPPSVIYASVESDHGDEKVTSSLKFDKARISKSNNDLSATSSSSKKLTKGNPLTEKSTKDTAKSKTSSSIKDEDMSHVLKSKEVHVSPSITSKDHPSPSTGDHLIPSVVTVPQNTRNGLKTSMRKVVQQFRASKQSKCESFSNGTEIASKHKLIFPYEMFVKLYSHDTMLLGPFGLTNIGNSCYANVVFQCLAFTRPFASYLFQGLHAKTCRRDWCFVCEFEYLFQKAREGASPLSPIRILSKLHKIGSHLGHGKEEDAHEFLRYAVDTMQSVFLNNAGATGPLAEESTLVGMTFGGYLLSKIKCMRCLVKSERCERMMDLTVEIDGEIGTLEEALAQFTANETLDRNNKYHCSRCKSYERAKKKLTILEAPNILTIVLKRFKSGNFEKLSKSVRFPEKLDIYPYMSRTSDKPPLYSLYAVVVHLDVNKAAFSGHYVCYVKNIQGNWFKTDDTTVHPVEIERVLSQGAYILLYARRSPRPPAMIDGGDGGKSKKRNVEAVPSGVSKSKPSIPSSDRFEWRSNSSSESSSIFGSSDTSSSSTDDFSDFIFGEAGNNLYRRYSSASGPEFESAVLYSSDTATRQHRKSSYLDNVLWSDPFDVRTY